MTADRLPIAKHPGEVLVEVLREHGVSDYRIAAILRVPYTRIYEIVRGRRGISADTALRLERALGLSAAFWMSLQVSCDLAQARALSGDEIGTIEPVIARPAAVVREDRAAS